VTSRKQVNPQQSIRPKEQNQKNKVWKDLGSNEIEKDDELVDGKGHGKGIGGKANGKGVSEEDANGKGVSEEDVPHLLPGNESDEEQDPGDVRHMKKMIDPCLPTRSEILEHELSHLPYRNWCTHCVKGRANERYHPRAERDPDGLPEIHVDYCFPCGSTSKEGAPDVMGGLTVLAMRERDSRMSLFTVVPRKGATGEYAARRAAGFCKELGFIASPIIIRSDQEPAIKSLVEDIARWRAPAQTVIEMSPVGSSQSNGVIERAIQSFEGLLRTMKSSLEHKWKSEIPAGHAVYSWMSEYCSFLLNRFEVGADGKTAYERLKGKKAKMQGLEFAEGVWFKNKRTNQPKHLSVWQDGIYLGIKGLSGEMVIGTKDGIWKTRTCQRKPKEERWREQNAEMVGGVPWCINKEDEDADGKMPESVIKMDAKKLEEDKVMDIKEAVEIPRSFPITKDDLEKHGFSEKCPGCKAVLRNTARQGHSAECRSRLSKLMKSDDKVKEAHQKEMEFHEKVHEDMQKRLKEREEEAKLEAEEDEPTKRRRKEVPNGGHKRVREE